MELLALMAMALFMKYGQFTPSNKRGAPHDDGPMGVLVLRPA